MRLTLISDTHTHEPTLPGGDILIHAGDLSNYGYRTELYRQLNYLHEQTSKYQYVILTPGNHDLFAERHPYEFQNACIEGGLILLINEGLELGGFNFWASPVTPRYKEDDWAYAYKDDKRAELWETIPENTNVLITHAPALGVLDRTRYGTHIGCAYLKERIDQLKNLKLHVFGHVHEKKSQQKCGQLISINAAQKVINIELK